MKDQELILSLAQKIGVSGDERRLAEELEQRLEIYTDQVVIDNSGSVLAQIKTAEPGKPHILLDAHMDEIGLIVTGYAGEGFLRVAACGGVDKKLLLAQEVEIHGKREVYGVIASRPPHLESREDQKKVPEIDDILIDTGYDQKELENLVSLGDRVTLKSKPLALLNDVISSKALDDRSGVAAILMVLELLKDRSYSAGLSVLFSVQEETGERGAKTGAFDSEATECIAVDVSFAYTSDAPAHKCGKLGEGVMIGISPTLTRRISDRLIALAEQHQLPYQLEVMGGATSTNADALALTKNGMASGLCSIPLRYMHTPIETIQTEDVKTVARLLAEYVAEAGDRNV